jgi:HNH endonuclease
MVTRGRDKFGFRLGTKRAQAAQLYETGATQAEIKAAIGYPHYNMLKDAERWGHHVKRIGDRFWLKHGSAPPDVEADVEEIEKRDDLTRTEKDALVRARRGQGQYRRDVIRLWGGRCAVTGCSVQRVLEACHIKPWKISSDSERLDAQNGLCLVANLHRLFDAGLIAFDDVGRLIVSEWLPQADRAILKPRGRLRKTPSTKQREHLKLHRDTVFKEQRV